MATKKPNEVAVKSVGEISAFAQDQVPDYINKTGGRGSEEVKTSDMILPRLELVQALSPIRDESAANFNPEAREGMMFNSVTNELYGELVYFVPIYFRLEWLVWKDQEKGGGFLGSYPTQDQAEQRKLQAVEEEPELAGKSTKGFDLIQVIDTPVHFGLRITPEGYSEQIVLSMARTKAKISRKWNAMIQIAGGDRFGRVYKISSFTDENKKNQKFKNYVIQPTGFPPKEIYKEAERVYTSFRSGEIQADHGSVGASDTAETAAASSGNANDRGEI